ncbi:hypothetical protein AB0C06_26720 [Micromonospora inaquosa]|uniref:hypothetical protein n=1 Tax=Micromonospora inaquosa TaxID=2203716 RepID=UPI001FCA19AB|nr:hypothetical protein [Micromonospora inaquosa]
MTAELPALGLWSTELRGATDPTDAEHGPRTVLGSGVSNAHAATQAGQEYGRPVQTMGLWLDALDSAPRPIPARLGFTDDDLVPGGSDRLIDALVGWGGLDAVATRVREHLDAGANHVALHVLRPDVPDRPTLPLPQWRDLATLLPSFAAATH